MKAVKLLILLIFISSVNLYSQALEELEKQIAANNNISKKIRFDHKYSGEEFSKTGIKSSVTSFDKKGNTTKIEYFNPKGVSTGSEVYKYDANSNRIFFERTGNSPYKKVSMYNGSNEILRESGFNGTEEFLIDYKYNSSGKLSEVINKVGDQIQQKMVYNYSGNTANINIYIRGTDLSARMKMTYDSKGNLIEESTYNLEGKEVEKKQYKYSADSKILEETKMLGGKFDYRINYEYDSKGRLRTLSEETRTKKKYVKKEYIYDAFGNLYRLKWRRSPDQDFNIKSYSHNTKGVCLSEETLYPRSNYRILSKFEYNYH
jgi:hypothetical protein